MTFARLARCARPALVNGTAGFIVAPDGRPLAVAVYTVAHAQVVEIDPLAAAAPSPPARHPFAGARAGRLREAAGIRDPGCVANHEMTNQDAQRCNKSTSPQLGDRYGS